MRTTFTREWIWPLALMLCIFLVSGASRLATPGVDLAISKDKIGHILVFGLLATSILRLPHFRQLGWQGVCCAIFLTAVFGAFDEIRQSFTPGRTVEFADWLADLLGAIAASLAYHCWPVYRRWLEWPVQKKVRTLFRESGP